MKELTKPGGLNNGGGVDGMETEGAATAHVQVTPATGDPMKRTTDSRDPMKHTSLGLLSHHSISPSYFLGNRVYPEVLCLSCQFIFIFIKIASFLSIGIGMHTRFLNTNATM